MIVIQRRYNTNDWEQIAVYKNGELTGDDDFVEAYQDHRLFTGDIDGDKILRPFSGPNLVASIDDTDSN